MEELKDVGQVVDLGEPEGGDLLPSTRTYDPEPARESIRGYLAVAAMALLVFLVLATFATLVWVVYSYPDVPDTTRMEPLKTVLELLLSPIVAIVGSVTGFYFGGQAQKPK
jgi:hypothetical protein